MFRTGVVEKIETRILCSTTFSRKLCSLWDNVGKYCTAGRANRRQYNTAHAHCMLH